MKKLSIIIISAVAILSGTRIACAVTYYWDTNDSYIGFGAADGSWGFDSNWSVDPLGTAVPLVNSTTADDILHFGTAAHGLAAGTITIDSDSQSFQDLCFGAASGEITLAGGILNLVAPTSTIHVTSSCVIIDSMLAGANELHIEGTHSDTPLTHMGYLTDSPTTIFTNTNLTDFVGAGGMLGGKSINHSSPTAGKVFYFQNDGTIATWQLQLFDDKYTKCIKIELTQTGADIEGRVVYAKYISGRQLGYDFDTGGTATGIATSYNTSSYGAAVTSLTPPSYAKLTFSGANSYSGGTVVKSGILEAISTAAALPDSGGITINSNAELILRVGLLYSNSGGVGNGNLITVNGGTLTLAAPFSVGYNRPITVNGGIINSIYSLPHEGDNSNYMNNLTLMNGASITGYKIRVGNFSAPTITVSGSSACSIPAGISMLKHEDDSLIFAIADVTGDSAADLIISGVLKDYNQTYSGLSMAKTGAGTLSLTAANTYAGVIKIDEGALSLNANDTLNTNNLIVLNGGTLEVGAFSNSVNMLTLSTNSVINLGSGQIAFADSSAQTWSGTLTLSGTLTEKSVRFGTNSSALTRDQRRMIFYKQKEKIRLDLNGYVTSQTERSVMLIR